MSQVCSLSEPLVIAPRRAQHVRVRRLPTCSPREARRKRSLKGKPEGLRGLTVSGRVEVPSFEVIEQKQQPRFLDPRAAGGLGTWESWGLGVSAQTLQSHAYQRYFSSKKEDFRTTQLQSSRTGPQKLLPFLYKALWQGFHVSLEVRGY